MGCGVCANICPTKSLTMVPMESQLAQQDVWTYMTEKVSEKKDMQDNTVKGSQFKQPMLEFSAAAPAAPRPAMPVSSPSSSATA